MLNQPSSTITAATIAGMGMTMLWELLYQFTAVDWRPALVSGSVVFVSSLFGYLKKENVYTMEKKE